MPFIYGYPFQTWFMSAVSPFQQSLVFPFPRSHLQFFLCFPLSIQATQSFVIMCCCNKITLQLNKGQTQALSVRQADVVVLTDCYSYQH